jgi:hypothetical protein
LFLIFSAVQDTPFSEIDLILSFNEPYEIYPKLEVVGDIASITFPVSARVEIAG